MAPRISDTIALSRTLAAAATPNQNCPSAGPRRSMTHSPIAYDTTEYVKIVLARSYRAHATGTTARPLGVRAARPPARGAGPVGGAAVATSRMIRAARTATMPQMDHDD